MQIGRVGLQFSGSTQPPDNGSVQSEDREQLRNLPTHQEPSIDLKEILANHTTLNQLLDADLQAVPSVEKVDIDRPEPETDDGDVHALPEDIQRQCRINDLALRIVIYERDRRNSAMQRADNKLDELLENVHVLLENPKLTSEQSEALNLFSSQVNQAKESFDPLSSKFFVFVDGFSADALFAELESAFDVLAESFSWAGEGTAVEYDPIKNVFQETFDVPDMTEEEIAGVLSSYIGTYEVEERATEDQQLVRDSMPEIIEVIKKFRPDFCVAT